MRRSHESDDETLRVGIDTARTQRVLIVSKKTVAYSQKALELPSMRSLPRKADALVLPVGKSAAYVPPRWRVNALLVVLSVYDAYLLLSTANALWYWAYTSLDWRFALLSVIRDLPPPILAVYAYATAERRILKNVAQARIRNAKSEHLFRRCVRKMDLKQKVALWNVNLRAVDAFTFGRINPNVVVTCRLIELLSDHELEGVFLHELAHVRNGDYRIMTWASSLVNVYRRFSAIYLIAVLLTIALDLSLQVGNPVLIGTHAITTLLIVFVCPMLLVNSHCRNREYEADRIAYSFTTAYPRGLLKATSQFEPIAGNEGLSLLPKQGAKNLLTIFETHPPIVRRLAAMRVPVSGSFRNYDAITVGAIAAISSILLVLMILSSFLFIVAQIPAIYPSSEQTSMRASLALIVGRNFETVTYAVEFVAPAVALFSLIPTSAEEATRKALARGLASTIGILILPFYFLLPEQGVGLGGVFPIPRAIWPTPANSTYSLLFSTIVYSLALCILCIIEWLTVPKTKRHIFSKMVMQSLPTEGLR